MARTSGIDQRFPYSALNPVLSLTKAIEASDPDLVIPCDDRGVQHLHELYWRSPLVSRSNLRSLIERSLGSPESYPIVSSRKALIDVAREEGLRVPETWSIQSEEDLRAEQTRQPFPWVLKAEGTSGGHGVRIAHSAEHGRRFLAELTQPLSLPRIINRFVVQRDPFWLRSWWSQLRPGVVVQSHIRGRPANYAFFCWKGKVLAGISVEVVSAQGVLGSAVVVRVVDNVEMWQAAEKLAFRLGLSGFFGLDFMIEEESGAAFLVEMNPRCTPLSHLQLGGGRDMIAALYGQISGQEPLPAPPVTRDTMIAYFPQAWHWNRESELLRASFHDVPWEDPELVHELLKAPWPDRGVLARLSNRLRHTTFTERAARGGDFSASVLRDHRLTSSPGPHSTDPRCPPSVISLRSPEVGPSGMRDPLFLIHGVDGRLTAFHRFVRDMEVNRPIYGIQSPALVRGKAALTRVEDMAAYYIKEVCALHPDGPFHLLGYSFGGLVAFEMACQLHAQGQRLGLVGLIDNRHMGAPKLSEGLTDQMYDHWKRLLRSDGWRYAREKLRARSLRTVYALLDTAGVPIPRFLQFPYDINWFAAVRYVPRYFPGKVTLFQTVESLRSGSSSKSEWARVAGDGLEVREIPGDHSDVLCDPQVKSLAREVVDCLSRIDHERAAHSPVVSEN